MFSVLFVLTSVLIHQQKAVMSDILTADFNDVTVFFE